MKKPWIWLEAEAKSGGAGGLQSVVAVVVAKLESTSKNRTILKVLYSTVIRNP